MDASTSVPARSPGILLLDDDPFMLVVNSRMLQGMGYRSVATVAKAEVALAMLQQEPTAFDVVICDLNMPGMDGIEFLRILNASAFGGSVVLLSGEGARILHSVQRMLGHRRLVILGALEKPASHQSLGAVLDLWRPTLALLPPKATFVIDADEIHEAKRQQQWVLHYQPKVALESGNLTGVEALVRWEHPVHGLVYPDSFIDAAEECGAIDALTEWVLKRSAEQLVLWRSWGMQLGMAVNVSMENLRTPDFARSLATIVRAAGASPLDMTLEVTESRLMSPSGGPLESLVRLRMLRFGLSIDDFGTGHSSLAQLRDVPFSELKVDRGFVHGARHNQIIRPMLEGSIGIAKRLGLLSVAEGVETEDDWHLVREMGCDFAQGYFIGRPMAAESLMGWVTAWQARQARLVE